MKLIDLLVQELPKRGGWPEKQSHAWQDMDGEIRFGTTTADDFYPKERVLVEGKRCPGYFFVKESDDIAVTRSEYETALAANKPQWDGEGLPPVGCFVEFNFGVYSVERGDLSGNLPLEGQVVEVVSQKVTSDGNDVAVVYWDDDGAGRSACFVDSRFKPIRSEADKKRYAAIEALFEILDAGVSTSQDSIDIYDAIAEGKIPGVKLEG